MRREEGGGGCGGGFCLCHNKTNVPDFPIRLCHIPSSLIINWQTISYSPPCTVSWRRLIPPPSVPPENHVIPMKHNLGSWEGRREGGVVVEDFACVTIKLMYLISRSGSVIFPPHWSLIDRQFPIVPPVQSVGGDWSPLLPFLLKTMWSPKSSPHPWR